MFNHFFFDNQDSQQVLKSFLRESAEEHVVLVMDPPFGGLVEVLANTVKQIWAIWKEVNQGQLMQKRSPVGTCTLAF